MTFTASNATSMSTQIGENSEPETTTAATIDWKAPEEGGKYELIVKATLGETTKSCKISITVPTMVKTIALLDVTPDQVNAGESYATGYVHNEFEIIEQGISLKTNHINPSTGQIRGNQSSTNDNFYIFNLSELKSIGRIEVKLKSGISTYKPENTVFTTGETTDNLDNVGYYLVNSENSTVTYCIKDGTENQHFFKLALNNGATAGTCTVESIIVHFNPDAPAAATTVFHGTETGTGNTIDLAGASKKIHFTTSNGVNVWYKFVADDDNEIQPQAETDEDGFTKYEGTDGIELTTIGNLLHYAEQFGVKSDVQTIRVSDSTTSIREITAEGAAAGAIYDLQGRKVVAPAKGIFIVNGKKVRM